MSGTNSSDPTSSGPKLERNHRWRWIRFAARSFVMLMILVSAAVLWLYVFPALQVRWARGQPGMFAAAGNFKAHSLLRMRLSTSLLEEEPDIDEFRRWRKQQAELIKTPLVLKAALSIPGISELPDVRSVDDGGNGAADWLASEIQVSFPGDGQFLEIAMWGRDPGQIQQLVQAVTDAYLDKIVNGEKRRQLSHQDELEQKYFKCADELEDKRETLYELQRKLGADKTLAKDTPVSNSDLAVVNRLSEEVRNLAAQADTIGLQLEKLKVELTTQRDRVQLMQKARRPL